MGYGDGLGGWGWVGMGVVMVLLVGLVITGVAYLLRTGDRGRRDVDLCTPRQVLADRPAHGEITTTEYQDRVAALTAR